MEEVEFISEPVNIAEFITEWTTVVDLKFFDHVTEETKEVYVTEKMGISLDMMEELKNVCSTAALDDENSESLTKEEMFTSCPEGVNLSTIALQRSDLQRREESVVYRTKRAKRLKYKTDDGPLLHKVIKDTSDWSDDNVADPEAIINVRVYKPFVNRVTLPPCSFACQVLGSTELTALRDVIKCPSDDVLSKDLSNDPNNISGVPLNKEIYKGSCFYIEGQFYDDDRDPTATILSSSFVDWANRDTVSVGPFRAVSMQNIRFHDLTIRLGQPYLYMHQGNCEHLIVFSDLRILAAHECHDANKYPLEIHRTKPCIIKCRVCGMNSARWMTRGSEHCPEDPCYFCENCFKSFHYDKDGHKIGNFKAYAVQQNT